MKKFLIALAVVVTMLFSGVAVADETAVTDTTSWWDDFSNLSSVKLGYLGLDTDIHEAVIDEATGITWDMCASLPAAEWNIKGQDISFDVGISEAGIGFLAVTTDIADLGDLSLPDFPGSQFAQLNAGVFVGKNFFGTDDGIDYDDGWIFGAIVNFIGW